MISLVLHCPSAMIFLSPRKMQFEGGAKGLAHTVMLEIGQSWNLNSGPPYPGRPLFRLNLAVHYQVLGIILQWFSETCSPLPFP
jgi:hypothetical protein